MRWRNHLSRSSQVRVRVVQSRGDRRAFLELPYRLYKDDAHWVPPLRIAQKDILDTRHHPFYKTSDTEMFLAERDGRVVGRVMAIVNRAHNEFHRERAGFFGFFEVERDPEAGRALIEAAREWLISHGAEVMRGPVNPSTNYECGLLVEGFDLDPTLMMTYNPPYYAELLESCGFRKAIDLYAYYVDEQSLVMPEKLKRVADRLRRKEKITVRAVNIKDFKHEVELVRQVYNDAWSRNWGFVPVTQDEFEHLAKDLKQVLDPELVYIAERKEGGKPKPVGFFLAVPDLNQALKKINGRLLPFGILKLLFYSRKITAIRIITMGVIKECQHLGIAALFYEEISRRGRARGYKSAEMSWVLENNELMNRAAELLGGRRLKTYRIYELSLNRMTCCGQPGQNT
jgi:GNAT superfamily N-acetyltransferase